MANVAVGEMLPDVRLRSISGEWVSPSDYRGRRALVLVVLGESPNAALRELLMALADRYAEVRQEEAEVLAIVPGPREAMEALARVRSFPFPLLWDEDRRTQRLYGAMAIGALFVADRYGEIYFISRIEEGGALPSVEDILSWIRFTEAQCPE
ncbi:MAG: peroxiredoxin family protein [Blastocatellia bacterium]|nr:peroxiredoxin family protein [Blastocatellia bacterium]MCS7158000.1 peroxiredoxin family protein [Blastocatellia bacterium]MDW8167378.1 redoxin domain-containing protein [Acidobacteriota bacterium]MDW8257297.1 redoxin domain-containing protein [Acidobacteriota bacterium]